MVLFSVEELYVERMKYKSQPATETFRKLTKVRLHFFRRDAKGLLGTVRIAILNEWVDYFGWLTEALVDIVMTEVPMQC